MSHFKGDNPVTLIFAILFFFVTTIDHGETSYFSRDTTEVTPNTASKMTQTTQNDTVNVAEIAQKSNGNRAALVLQYLEKRSTAVPKTTAKRTTAAPTTTSKATVLTTALKRTTTAPKTTSKKTTVAPTTTAKQTTAAPKTTAKKTSVPTTSAVQTTTAKKTTALTTSSKRTTAAPKTTSKKTTVAPTTTTKRCTHPHTTTAKRTTAAPTTTKQTTAMPKTTTKKTTPVPTTTAKRTTAVPKTTANTTAATTTTKKPIPPASSNFFNFTSKGEVCILENITAEFTVFNSSSKNESVVHMTKAVIDKQNSHCGNSTPGKYRDAVLTVRWTSSDGGNNSLRQTYSIDEKYYYLKSYNWTLVTKKNGAIIAANSTGNNNTFRTMFGRSLTCENDTVLTYNGKNYTVTLTLSKVQLQAFDIIDGTFSESYECGTNPNDKTSVIIYIVIAVVTCIIVIAAIAIAFCIYQRKTAHTRAGYESV